jgi:hypothetical protein
VIRTNLLAVIPAIGASAFDELIKNLQATLGLLLGRAPDLSIAGPVTRVGSNFINGISRLPVRLDARAAARWLPLRPSACGRPHALAATHRRGLSRARGGATSHAAPTGPRDSRAPRPRAAATIPASTGQRARARSIVRPQRSEPPPPSGGKGGLTEFVSRGGLTPPNDVPPSRRPSMTRRGPSLVERPPFPLGRTPGS